MTKPTIKEKQSDTPSNAGLDEFTEYFIKNYPPNTVISNPAWHAPKLYRAATRTLERELAAIRSQPVPVEPLTFDHFTNSDHREDFGPVTEGRYVLKTDYGTLQSELQLAQEERDKRMTRMMAAEKRAEQAEAERDELQKRFDAEVEAFYEERELNRRMVELMKEPSASMIAAGYPPNDERSQSWDVTEVFKAMSAQLLKEAGE